MATAQFRFYEELNDFLPPHRSKVSFLHTFTGCNAIKDMIEALGVPHTEVDLILVNGRSVDFSYSVQDGDRVSVYPVFESFDITPLLRLRPKPLRISRFILDVHLGRLARYLRLLGFDTLYRNDYNDAELAHVAGKERRILLTRDRSLLKRNSITHGYYVRETDPRRQLQEVFARFDLYGAVQSFQRCTCCNGLLATVAKERIWDRLEPATRRYFDQFWMCGGCQQIYWKGSHYVRLQRLIEEVLRSAGRDG
jgi:uncharacterized protein with PIN domain